MKKTSITYNMTKEIYASDDDVIKSDTPQEVEEYERGLVEGKPEYLFTAYSGCGYEQEWRVYRINNKYDFIRMIKDATFGEYIQPRWIASCFDVYKDPDVYAVSVVDCGDNGTSIEACWWPDLEEILLDDFYEIKGTYDKIKESLDKICDLRGVPHVDEE